MDRGKGLMKEKKIDISEIIYDLLFMLLAAALVFILTVTNAFSRLDYLATDALYQACQARSR